MNNNINNIKKNIVELENIAINRKYSISHVDFVLSDIKYNLNQLSTCQYGGSDNSIDQLKALDERITKLKETITKTFDPRNLEKTLNFLNEVVEDFLPDNS